jgi:outer membrane biosynthesis protein TonB
VLFIVFGRQDKKAAASAENTTETPTQVEVAEPEPVKVEPPPPPPPPEPEKPEPAVEPAKPEPAKTEPAKPEPVKPERKKIEKGRVTIAFEGPAKATVLINGKPHGREAQGRVTVELAPGEHTVRVTARGYKSADTKVRVDAGGSRDVKLTLEKKKATVNAVHDPFAD